MLNYYAQLRNTLPGIVGIVDRMADFDELRRPNR